jgi:hypothetical protein
VFSKDTRRTRKGYLFDFTQRNSINDSEYFLQPYEDFVNPTLAFSVQPSFDTDGNQLEDSLVDFSFSPSHTLLHQHQQVSFQGDSTFEASNLSASQRYTTEIARCNFIQSIDESQSRDEPGTFSFQAGTNLDTTNPSATVQQPPVGLSDPAISNSYSPSSTLNDEPFVGTNLGEGRSSLVDSPSALSSADGIQCTWPSCNKAFPSIHVYNHHFKNHSRPFQCGFCPARHATKRQRDRHVNERHSNTEGYYCSVLGCPRSSASGGKPFPRIENCRRHMMMVHKFTADQAKACDMDEETRKIRAGRKVGRHVGG